MWPWNLMNDLEKQKRHLFYTTLNFVHHFKSIGEFKLELQSRNAQFRVKIGNFLSCVTLKFDGWPWKIIGLLFYTTLSFVQHFKAIDIFKLELQSRNAQFGSKLAIFLSWVTLKINVWPWKTIGYLFYTTSNIVHHFKSIGEVILELQTGNAQIGDFFVPPDLEIDVWPWTRQIWGIWKLRPAYSPETPNLGQNRWCFVLCDLEIWWMTLENNRAPLLCCFKLCATFHSHRWIQTGVAVRKRPTWVKFDDS